MVLKRFGLPGASREGAWQGVPPEHVLGVFFRWFLGCLVGVLGASWGVLGAFWGVLGASWGRLGASWGSLGAFCGRLGVSQLRLGGVLGRLGGALEHLVGVVGVVESILDVFFARFWDDVEVRFFGTSC